MIDLNEVLYGLTHLGPERYPMSKRDIIEKLSSFGTNLDKRVCDCENALEVMILSSHIEYVIDDKNRGGYRLARPHLRIKPDGDFILAGARSRDTIDDLPVSMVTGTTWKTDGIEIRQPDILKIKKENLDDIDDELLNILQKGTSKDWGLPKSDIPGWESFTLKGNGNKISHPLTKYGEDNCKLYDPDEFRWKSSSDNPLVFKYTGPLFLIRTPTYRYERFVLIVKNRKQEYFEYVLPLGLDNMRWGQLIVSASYGFESIRYSGDSIKVNMGARLPTNFSHALVDIDGKVPSFDYPNYTYHGIEKDIADRMIISCIHSFVDTEIYRKSTGVIR